MRIMQRLHRYIFTFNKLVWCKIILAHGKRSDTPPTRILTAKSLWSELPQNNIAHSSKMQWILSRLITGQPILPLTDKYPVRWNNLPKDKTFISSKWDAASLNDDNTISIRWIFYEEQTRERQASMRFW